MKRQVRLFVDVRLHTNQLENTSTYPRGQQMNNSLANASNMGSTAVSSNVAVAATSSADAMGLGFNDLFKMGIFEGTMVGFRGTTRYRPRLYPFLSLAPSEVPLSQLCRPGLGWRAGRFCFELYQHSCR